MTSQPAPAEGAKGDGVAVLPAQAEHQHPTMASTPAASRITGSTICQPSQAPSAASSEIPVALPSCP